MLIFKAKKIDYQEKIFKYLLIITAAAVLIIYLAGLYIKKVEVELNQDIKNSIQQLRKYKYLNAQTNNLDRELLTYLFLEKTFIYSENIILENIYIDRKIIIINAEAEKEKYIFEFLHKLHKDDLFFNAEVKEIAKNRTLNFTIHADLKSR